MSVLALLEQHQGELKACTLEVASKASQIAQKAGLPLIAIYIGRLRDDQVLELTGFGIHKLIVSESDDITYRLNDICVPIIHDLAQEFDSKIIIGPATTIGKELFASVAARLDAELLQDCIGADWENGLVARKAIYAGKIISDIRFKKTPAMVTLRPNVFPIIQTGADVPEVIRRKSPQDPHYTVIKDLVQTIKGEINLTEAKVVVAGGRGIGGPQNWSVLQELCDVMGAALGASRAAVDADWIHHAHQVGQTGKVVSPDLYIACGISGAIQHQAGMRSSKVIVAINKDPEAEIFKICDYGIVGDLLEVIPVLTQEARNTL
ncbi:MAG: electron transfer flavoprotein subunit alpha/FixB family protein, partial [Desulfobacteraceae bacterium]|nr:electron transfer flavoprotein subunit alpha/FixB family protein [Desulfobacteraceae bacterium]